jgi:protein-disulfide isomerase
LGSTGTRIAALFLLMAAFVSHLQQTARLPGSIARDTTIYFASSRAVAGIPIEFLLALWCLAVSAKVARDLKTADTLRFWSGIVVCALCVGVMYRVGLQTAPMIAASLAAAVVVGDAGWHLRQLAGGSSLGLAAAVRHDWGIVRQPQRAIGLIAAVAAAALAGQYLAFTAAGTTVADREAQLARWNESEPQVASPDLVAAGKIRVVVFSDYVCTACSIMVPQLEQTVRRYQTGYSNVEWVQKDFPLNADCNPAVTTRVRQLSCRTAVAARIAERLLEPSDNQAFRSRLYRLHGRITEADLARELDAAKLSGSFRESYDDALQAVRSDAVLGASLGVAVTPTIYVNGRLLRDPQPKVLAAILAHLVRATGTNLAAMTDNERGK